MAHATQTEFQPVNIAILTVSDSRTLEDDRSGDTLVGRLQDDGHILADRAIIKDEVPLIAAQLRAWCDNPTLKVDVFPTRLAGDMVEVQVPPAERC